MEGLLLLIVFVTFRMVLPAALLLAIGERLKHRRGNHHISL